MKYKMLPQELPPDLSTLRSTFELYGNYPGRTGPDLIHPDWAARSPMYELCIQTAPNYQHKLSGDERWLIFADELGTNPPAYLWFYRLGTALAVGFIFKDTTLHTTWQNSRSNIALLLQPVSADRTAGSCWIPTPMDPG